MSIPRRGFSLFEAVFMVAVISFGILILMPAFSRDPSRYYGKIPAFFALGNSKVPTSMATGGNHEDSLPALV